MRTPIFVAAVLAAAAPLPALAQDAETGATEFAETFSDPEKIERMSAMLAVLMDAMMEVPVGRLAEAVGEVGDGHGPDIAPDATLREVMGPDAEDASEAVAERLPQLVAMMGVMAEALDEMRPQLREAMERIERDLPAAE